MAQNQHKIQRKHFLNWIVILNLLCTLHNAKQEKVLITSPDAAISQFTVDDKFESLINSKLVWHNKGKIKKMEIFSTKTQPVFVMRKNWFNLFDNSNHLDCHNFLKLHRYIQLFENRQYEFSLQTSQRTKIRLCVFSTFLICVQFCFDFILSLTALTSIAITSIFTVSPIFSSWKFVVCCESSWLSPMRFHKTFRTNFIDSHVRVITAAITMCVSSCCSNKI